MLLEQVHSELADTLHAEHVARQGRFRAAGQLLINEQMAAARRKKEMEMALLAEKEMQRKALLREKNAQMESAESSEVFSYIGVPSICRIVARVAKAFGVRPTDIVAQYRTQGWAGEDIITPRHVTMYLAKTMTGKSFPDIGRSLGRDHSTIMHGVRKIAARIAVDDAFKAKVEALRASLLNNSLTSSH